MVARLSRDNTLENLPAATHSPETGFIENFKASSDVMFKQETFHSPLHYAEFEEARDNQIRKYEEEGILPFEVRHSLGDDYNAKAEWIRMFTDYEVDTDEDIRKKRADAALRDKQRMGEVYANSTIPGKIGSFLGSVAGVSADLDMPVYVASGYALLARSAKILSTAAKAGAIGATIEGAKQYTVQQNANQLEAPRTTNEILEAIAYNAGGEMIFAGLGAGLNKVKTSVFAKQLKQLAKEEKLTHGAEVQLSHAMRETHSGVAETADELIETMDSISKQFEDATPAPVYIHGTSKQAAEQIRRQGFKLPGKDDRVYDYSVLGPDTIYASTNKDSTWLVKGGEGRRATYEDVVYLQPTEGTNVVILNSIDEADNLARSVGFEDFTSMGRTMEVDSLTDLERGSPEFAERTRLANSTIARLEEAGIHGLDIRFEVDALDLEPQVAIFNPKNTKIVSEAEFKASSVAEEPGVTTHPADEWEFLTPEDRAFLKSEGAEIVPEAQKIHADNEIDTLTDCLVGNGVKI